MLQKLVFFCDSIRANRFVRICETLEICESQGPLNGGVSNGGVSRSGLVLPFLSLFCPFWDFPRFFCPFFPICPGMVRGFSLLVLFLFLGLLRAPYEEQSQKGPRNNLLTFPERPVGNPREEVWQTRRFETSCVTILATI